MRHPYLLIGAIILTFTPFGTVAPPDAPNGLVSHEVVRVSGPDSRSPVETSVAINPTRPDHVIAVCLQPSRPGTTNFAYVSEDAGRTWKTVPTPNPGKRTQGDDSIAFTA